MRAAMALVAAVTSFRTPAMSLLQVINPFKRFYDEQRRSPREYVSFPAWIAVGTGTVTVPCTVLDVSEHGARIEVAHLPGVPDEFYIFLSKDGTRRRRCRIAWRSDVQIGVIYMGYVEVSKITNLPAAHERSHQRASSSSVEFSDLWISF